MRAPQTSFLSDTTGNVATEYLIVFLLIGIAVVGAVAPLLGPSIAEEYVNRPKLLHGPYP